MGALMALIVVPKSKVSLWFTLGPTAMARSRGCVADDSRRSRPPRLAAKSRDDLRVSDLTEQQRWVLLAASPAVGLAFLDETAVVTALPTIQREFGATSAEVQWVMGAYLLALASLMAAPVASPTSMDAAGCSCSARRCSASARLPGRRAE